MTLVELQRNPTSRQLRQFALLWPCLLLVAAWWFWYRDRAATAAAALVVCAVASAVLGLWRPAAMRGPYIAWMVVTFPIAWIVAHALMAAVYFLIITPIGLMLRARRDPLERRFDATTYWKPRESRTDPSSYFRQY